jgi:hypothetical protein
VIARTTWVALALFALAVAACKPSTVLEAEATGDVKWLDANSTPDAIAALGRLADKNPKAVTTLSARTGYDPHAFKAAWDATVRGADWGRAMLRDGLSDPTRAESAASQMARNDPHLAPFASDLEQALARLSASMQNFNIASALANIGAPARLSIERRLNDASSRGAMCRGIASKDGSTDARKALLDAPESSRDNPFCVDAVVRIAAEADDAMAWLAMRGEPGLLGAAGKSEVFACARLHTLWSRTLAERTPEAHAALTVPLGHAVHRCTVDMDGVLADALARMPAAHPLVVNAIDPYEAYGKNLRATCAALQALMGGRDPAIVKERAGDALSHGCKAP